MNWFAEFSRFTKILAASQHPDIRINADTQRKYPSSMNHIEVFLNASTFAVAGASQDRSKYGNKVFRAIVASGRTAYPLNPTAPEFEGHPAFASISDLPVVPESLSIVTQPHVTREVIQQAIAAGVKNIWMQPGAEDSSGSQDAREAGLNVIDDGSCILVLLSIERSSKQRSIP
jgi:predicted CoA-binding protein